MPQVDTLPLYSHPFIGSHDAAANSEATELMYAARLPFTQTQSLDFYEQYNNGARWFDLRVQETIIGSDVTFKHGPILLLDIPAAPSFFRMLYKAVQDREIVLLDFNHFPLREKDFIVRKIEEYLVGSGLYPHSQQINGPMDFRRTLGEYKREGKFILWYANWGSGSDNDEFIKSNYNSSMACFKQSVVLESSCKKLSCLDGVFHETYRDLFDSILNDDDRKTRARREGDYRLQKTTAHFQAPVKPFGTQGSLKCLPGLGGQAIEQEILGSVNSNILDFFTIHERLMPNIVSMDNVNHSSYLLKELLEDRARAAVVAGVLREGFYRKSPFAHFQKNLGISMPYYGNSNTPGYVSGMRLAYSTKGSDYSFDDEHRMIR